MTLKEFNEYVIEFNNNRNDRFTSFAWQIVNFVGLLIGGKFKDLKNYLPKRKINKEQKNNTDDTYSLRERKVLEAQKFAESLGHNF